jgi:uncharacterized protein (TIGR02271 family)
MAYETIVAVFDAPSNADAAVKALRTGGFADADISIFDQKRLASSAGGKPGGFKEIGVWRRLFGDEVREHEATVFGQTIERGGNVVSVRVLDSEVAQATAILDLHRPVSVPDRAMTTGVAEPAYVEAVEKKRVEAASFATKQQVAVTPKLAEAQPDVLRLAEEQLKVGKEMVETGRTRVRRFVTEKEGTAEISLHDEHAEVMRRAITDPKYIGEIDWADRAIEVVETAEHALVNKTARIVEEVSLKKIGADHVETVRDKLRRQQVEVEHLPPSNRSARPEQISPRV